jgi:hypothetical protein
MATLPDIAAKDNPGCASLHRFVHNLPGILGRFHFGAAGNQDRGRTISHDVTKTVLG